ncbi:MarR family winged helix-turn-helix transcriptional regulator [Streptomyces hoynatensis]|uniref:MarR family transcriptional regulator n=1 Tax=Streptomyces hoynatensis TaxID=1141874 RepID=A0A3A9YPQ1_9ACTN|nr:MarR family transcriptional regulator [Streptomyces hoynatensis]RKN37983.1 MarR family transcriptional regulator [Streptomyces hoynatensis]
MASGETPEPAPSIAAAAAELRRGVSRLGRRLRAERRPEALSTNKISILGLLYARGPSTPGDLAAADRQRPQSLTRVFAQLERDGLITRAPDPGDRRQSVLALTAAGREAFAADMAQRDAWLASALAVLNETEREVLRLAARLMDRLAEG